MLQRPKRSIKPPQNLKEYFVVAELDEEKTKDFKSEVLKSEAKSVFKCKKCGIICKNKNEIFSHIKRHKGKESYVCEECGKTLSSLQAFSEHSNIHKNIKPYRCEVCGLESRQISVHSRHLLTHDDNLEKLYRCTVCSKSFKQKDYLKQHIRKHVGEKPYECTQCQKKFTCKSELNRHVISHSSLRPFSCKHCNKKFKLKHNLYAHVRSHMKPQVWKCSLCKASFSQQYLMEKHKKSHTQVVQHLELIKNDPQTLSITSCPLDRRKVLHHQKMSLPSKLDLNDVQNSSNSKMSLGLNDAFIPISVIASSFGTGNYIRMKIVDKVLLGPKNGNKTLQVFNGLTNAVLVENDVALKGEEWEQAVVAVDGSIKTEEINAEVTKVTETENQMDFTEKFEAHFDSFENLFKNDEVLEEDKMVWLNTLMEIIKEICFPLENSVCDQFHTIIVKLQTLLVKNIQDIQPTKCSLDLHAPSCNMCNEKTIEDTNEEEEINHQNLRSSETNLKVELCNDRKQDKENLKTRLKELSNYYNVLSDCLYKQINAVLDL